MASWAEFTAASPEQAAVAERLWPGLFALERGESYDGPVFEIVYLATVRPDGGPRVHPICPVLAGGRMFAAIPTRSPKGDDLRRDPRCVLHALPGPDDDEICIRARAIEVDDRTDPAARRMVIETVRRSGVGGMVETTSNDPMFEFDLERVDTASWVDVGQAGTYAERARWP